MRWGPSNKLPSAAACCADCQNYHPPTPEDLECNGNTLLGSPGHCCGLSMQPNELSDVPRLQCGCTVETRTSVAANIKIAG